MHANKMVLMVVFAFMSFSLACNVTTQDGESGADVEGITQTPPTSSNTAGTADNPPTNNANSGANTTNAITGPNNPAVQPPQQAQPAQQAQPPQNNANEGSPTEEITPPQGFYDALADLNTNLGTDFSFSCSDPNNADTCRMSDPQMQWRWSRNTFPNDALDCPTMAATNNAQTEGYIFLFAYQGTQYDYRQPINGDWFLCAGS